MDKHILTHNEIITDDAELAALARTGGTQLLSLN